MAAQLWIVVRQFPDEMAEPLAILDDRAAAVALSEELGEGHFIAACPFLAAADKPAIVHTWVCRATVAEGVVKAVLEPEQLRGASRLFTSNEERPAERVIVDHDAAKLEAAVLGRAVAHLTAQAATSERAAELAREAAERLAASQRRDSL